MKPLAIIAAIALICAYAYVGSEDADLAADEHEYHCEMVAKGAWPNYDNRDCKGE